MSFENQRYILTGGPGAGKTTVIKLLAARGFLCVPDHARMVIKSRKAKGLSPRPDPSSFGNAVLKMDVQAFERTKKHSGPVFYERGVFDSLYLHYQSGTVTSTELEQYKVNYPYASTVFFFPPWEEIYVQDAERDHSFEHAVKVGKITKDWYQELDCVVVEVPQLSPEQRVNFILAEINIEKW